MIITGLARLGRDAEVRHTPGGDIVANLSLAVSFGKRGPDQPTQWIDGSMWGKRAEAVSPYLKKGTLIYFVAEDPHIEEFSRRDGTRGAKLVARVSSVEFAGGKRDESAPAAAPVPAAAPSGFADMTDDIQF